MPLVLAVLLAFALAPLANWLRRRARLPDALAVIVAVIFAFLVLASLAVLAGLQITRLAQELPGYQQTVVAKLHGVQQQFGGGAFFERITTIVADVSAQLSPQSDANAPDRAVPVVISNEAGPLGLLTSVLGSIIGPVATAAIVVIFLVFLLLGRADLTDRFIRLVGSGDYSKANIAIADASKRVGKYLLVQLAVNCAYGAVFGLGLWLIGVPSAPLWGVLIVVFRYIPFIGALILAMVPFLLAFAVDPGWNMLFLSVALFLVLDLTTANVIEPRLYGSSTGVSPLAILLSAMFWATLWGPIGLILATPMTVCLVVIGRHLPQFQFLDTLLGSEPVLTPPEQLYQRMLKGDTEGAIETMEDYIADHDEDAYLRDVLFPTLTLAGGELTDRPEALGQRRLVVQSVDLILAELDGSDLPPHRPRILLVGGKTELDECAARLLGLILGRHGVASTVLPPLAVKPEALRRLDLTGVKEVVLVHLGDHIGSQARYISRRLRAIDPTLRMTVCAFADGRSDETAEKLHVEAIYHSEAEAVPAIVDRWGHGTSLAGAAPSGFSLPLGGEEALGRALQEVARRFDVAVTTVNLLADERHKSDEDAYRLTQIIAETGKPLIFHSDAPKPELAANGFLQTGGVHFYAGVPLVVTGECIGALVLLDYKLHPFTDEQVTQLSQAAEDLVLRFGTEGQAGPKTRKPMALAG